MKPFSRSNVFVLLASAVGIFAAVAFALKSQDDPESKAYGEPDGEVSDGSTASFVD